MTGGTMVISRLLSAKEERDSLLSTPNITRI